MADSTLRREQPFRRQVHQTQATRHFFGTCVCLIEDCANVSKTRNAFFTHLCTDHSNIFVNLEKYRLMFDLFATTYFLIDTQMNYKRFAHICKLCRKHLRPNDHLQGVETTVEEDSVHLNDHFAVPEFACNVCKVWLNSKSSAERHAQSSHSNAVLPVSGNEIFAPNSHSLRCWQELTRILLLERNLSFDTINQFVREHTGRRTQIPEEQTEFIRSVMRNERNLKSIEELKGNYLIVFKAIGDKNFIGSRIMAASDKAIRLCCEEVNDNILEMLLDTRAASALVSLLMRSPDHFWNSFVAIVNQNRHQIYNSLYSAHAIRRLMTTVVNDKPLLSDRRAISLGRAFIPIGSIEAEMINSTYAGYFFMSIAMRDSYPAECLARHFALYPEELAQNRYTNLAYRFLIKSAIKNRNNTDYNTFLHVTVSVIFVIANHEYGANVAQSIIYNAPQYCQTAIHTILNQDWIFGILGNGTQRYQSTHLCQLVQTALVVSEPEQSNRLSIQLNNADIESLLHHKVANNILRRMAEIMVDPNILHNFYQKVSKSNTFLDQRFGRLQYAKNCTDLINRRYRMVLEQSATLTGRQDGQEEGGN